jgi:hypothetical protein
MNILRLLAIVSASSFFLGLCCISRAQEPADFTVTTKQFGFPVIDTAVTFTREKERTYRVRYSNPPPSPEYAMLYTGFYFCAAHKLAVESGYDRAALIPAPDSAQSGVAAFLRPGESASQLTDQRFANVTFTPIQVMGTGCPTQLPPAKR